MQYRDTGAEINFNQGLDIRIMRESDMEILEQCKKLEVHFAWDNPEDNLEEKFRMFAERFKGKIKRGRAGIVFVLTNYGSTPEQDRYRVETLRMLGYSPFVMIYNKPEAPIGLRRYQRYVNNKYVFRACTWEEYNGKDRNPRVELDGQMQIEGENT